MDLSVQLYLVDMMCSTESIVIRADVSESLCKIISHECDFDAKRTLNSSQPTVSPFLQVVWQ